MVKNIKVTGVWRKIHIYKTQFTWSGKQITESSRVNYFLGNDEVNGSCITCLLRLIILQYTEINRN